MVNSDEKNKWIRPWNLEKFDNIYNRDERYFSILMKGLLSWLNRNVIMYNKPILHFVTHICIWKISVMNFHGVKHLVKIRYICRHQDVLFLWKIYLSRLKNLLLRMQEVPMKD